MTRRGHFNPVFKEAMRARLTDKPVVSFALPEPKSTLDTLVC